MEETSSKKRQGETQVCPICGSVNNAGSKFCDSCGNPMELASDFDLENEYVPEIAVGYATSIRSEKESKDSLVVLDLNSFFVSEQQRRILCVMAKGLEKLIEGKRIVNDILIDILPKKAASAFQSRLSELQKELHKRFTEAKIKGEVKGNENGYLVSILDSGRLTSICLGSSTTYVLNTRGFRELPKESSADLELKTELLSDNDYVCMCSISLSNLLGTKELQGTVLKAENPQEACNELLRKAMRKRSDSGYSIVTAKIISTQ
jgi:hypothetical protein